MKNTLLIFAFFALSLSAYSTDNWNNAQWIWQTADGHANGWVSFRKTINLANVPANATANIAADSKFWLWVNGEMVVFEGGMSHGPSRAGVWNRDINFTPTNNLSGIKLIDGEENGNFVLDMGSIATGVYLLEVITHEGISFKRILIE